MKSPQSPKSPRPAFLRARAMLLAALLPAGAALAETGKPAAAGRSGATIGSLEELRAARAELEARPRRLIANNDGCDALYFPRDTAPSAQGFLDLRTSSLAGSQVGTISYCTISSGFGHFTHDTKVGTVLARQGLDYGIRPDARNITADLIAQGTDPLKAVTAFAHGHGMESFWSMRMNDTHDVEHRPDKPYFLFPQWKTDHPDWLVGDPVKRTPHGRWSSVDYARNEVRELAFRFIEEVCRNYDVDGVELDFFRHLCYFKSVANGGAAAPEEVAAMTDLMRRVRRMTEDVGLARRRPILVAMRVPDSLDYSLEMGFDLETWLEEGLMDILITTDYFRLNPWSHSVELGHRHGVKVYPALTDPRVKDETRFHRAGLNAYRARAASAWASGADGLYLFNLYDIDRKSPLWRELGDPAALALADKDYFLTDLDGKPTSWLAKGDRHQTIPVVTPTRPAQLSAKSRFETRLLVAEDLDAAREAGREPRASLHLELPGLSDPARVSAVWNGKPLSGATPQDGWLDWTLDPASVRKGENELAIRLSPATASSPAGWTALFDGGSKPAAPWKRDAGSARVQEEIRDGAFLLADRGADNGDYAYYRAPWGADPEGESVLEARVKVLGGASHLILSNGIGGERVRLAPDGVSLFHRPGLRHAMDTTDAFHRYRVVLKGADLEVFVDDALRLEAPGALGPRPCYPRNEVAFGAANSPETGEALWGEVKFRAARLDQPLHDVVLGIRYGKP